MLDFPTREAFARELTGERLRHRRHLVHHRERRQGARDVPHGAASFRRNSTIVVGGHVAAIPGIDKMIDADHIVHGDGISWMRRYLGEDENAPIRHPHIVSGFGLRTMGLRIPETSGQAAATIIPSVGCPMGCNFCTTSAFFGGKGKFLNFYETGDELFRRHVRDGIVHEGPLVLHDGRELPALQEARHGAARPHEGQGQGWALYVFSSANAIRKYTIKELVELGISWIWMGLESPHSSYAKLQDTDTLALTRELRAARHQAAGLDHRRPGASHAGEHPRRDRARRRARDRFPPVHALHAGARHAALPGDAGAGPHADDVDLADIHGQDKFNFQHAAISREDSKQFLDWAFRRDFERNGPSLFRICRTTLAGWKRYKDHPDPRVRERFEWEVRSLKSAASGLLWAMEHQLRKTNQSVSTQVRDVAQGPGPRVRPHVANRGGARSGAAVDQPARAAPPGQRGHL